MRTVINLFQYPIKKSETKGQKTLKKQMPFFVKHRKTMKSFRSLFRKTNEILQKSKNIYFSVLYIL